MSKSVHVELHFCFVPNNNEIINEFDYKSSKFRNVFNFRQTYHNNETNQEKTVYTMSCISIDYSNVW